jgi:signal transduction histidine kinase
MRRPEWLRYLLVAPLIGEVRARERRSLGFRLVTSHFIAIFAVPAVVLLVFFAVALGISSARGHFSWPGAFLGLSLAAAIGSLVFLLPGVAVASFMGIRRARAISDPVRELSGAAAALAQGDLSRRANVEGEDELAALGRSFNTMAARLQETLDREASERARAESALSANRDLVANVSHELRTPVSVIRSHLEAQLEHPERGKDYTGIALRETDRLQRLVDDLFALSRLEAGMTRVERAPFDAAAAVREAVASLAEPARREANVMVQAGAPGVCHSWAIGDRERIVQVVQNFIRNAIRFTLEGGIVLAQANERDGHVEIAVSDTGCGIATEDLAHVFERFYRADTSRSRASGGAGLGLAIAKDLVEAMGGTVRVESQWGEGATFIVRLPAAARVG